MKNKKTKKLNILLSFVSAMLALMLLTGFTALAEESLIDEEWKYTSISFGADASQDLIMGGVRFYSEGTVFETVPSGDNQGSSYGSSSKTDADSLRTAVGGRDCVAAVEHYCFNRESNALVPGYLYFDLPSSFTAEEKVLTVEIDFFDSSSGYFVLRYINGESATDMKAIRIYGSGSGTWRRMKIRLTDACFNRSVSTGLADGKCDFRLERAGYDEMLAVRHIAVYTGEDKTTGRSYKNASVSGENVLRAYFTAGMWSSDSRSLMVYNAGDGYVYKYNLEDDSLVPLVRTNSTAFYVTPGNYMYYYDRTNVDLRRMHIETLEAEKIADMYPASYGIPSNIHVNNDDTKLTVQVYETDESGNKEPYFRRIPMLDIKTGIWDLNCYHEFEADNPLLGHIIINPEYDNLVFFCHEGTTTEIPDRLWEMDFETGEAKNIFIQQSNSLPDSDAVKTGETSGHEQWTADGEHLTFVKYSKPKNVGMNGIVRIDKYGEKREYISDDYDYWHSFPSADNRFVVADCMLKDGVYHEGLNMKLGSCKIVLADIKTSRSHLLAEIPAGDTHPYQPHPCISPDGKLVCFSVCGADTGLNFGIMDISDISDGTMSEAFEADTNEDRGFEISDPVYSDGKIRFDITGTRKQNNEYMFFGVTEDDKGIESISLSKGVISRGEKKSITLDGDKYYIWSSGLRPLKLTPGAPEKLRFVSMYAGCVRLMWFAPANLNDDGVKYEVYRDGVYLDTVTDGYYLDNTPAADEEYTYSVRAVYPGGTVSPYAEVYGTVHNPYAVLSGDRIRSYGLDFRLNNTNTSADSYTESAVMGDRLCRKSTSQIVVENSVEKTKTGMFYFSMKDDTLRWENEMTITVEYFDNGTKPLYLQYNAADGSIAKSLLLARRTGSDEWCRATVTLQDAAFEKAKALTYSDFRINGGADTYIYSVTVSSQKAGDVSQCSEWMFNKGEGMIAFLGSGVLPEYDSENNCALLDEGDVLFCEIDDSFMYADCRRGVTLETEYFDMGEGSIYLSYGTNDVTYTGDASSKTVKLADFSGSGEWVKSELTFVDGFFRNLQENGADFSIISDSPLKIRSVKIRHGA